MQQSIQSPDPKLDAIDELIVKFLRDRRTGARARNILDELARNGQEISQPTLSRRLTRLEQQKHVIVLRRGRSTLYERDPYHDWLAIPPTRRKKVAYSVAFLAGYEPNKTRWLTDEEIARLDQAGGGRHMKAGTYARAIAQKLLVDLSYASSALEGNTYSYLDTQVLIELGQVAQGKELEETQMILNHKEAINYLIDHIDEIEIDTREIRTLHALLARNMPSVLPTEVGTVRNRIVDIGGTAYVPMAISQVLVDELEKIAVKARAVENPFEQSLFLLGFISYLQAFVDVNKRTARLACNIPLLKHGLAPLSFIDTDKAKYVEGLLAFYELNRVDILKEVFIEGYVAAAKRYDAYTARDKAAVELEFRRRTDIYGCVQTLVKQSIEEGSRPDTAEFAKSWFEKDKVDLREQLVRRVVEIVNALSEGNHIAYGISKKDFDAYAGLDKPEDAPTP